MDKEARKRINEAIERRIRLDKRDSRSGVHILPKPNSDPDLQ
jgi:hypothetical protein